MSCEHVRFSVPQPAFILSSPDATALPVLPSLVNGLIIYLLSNLENWSHPGGLCPPHSFHPISHPKHLMSIVSSPSPTVLEAQESDLSQKLGIWIRCFALRRDCPSRKRVKSKQRRGQEQRLGEHTYLRENGGKVSTGG